MSKRKPTSELNDRNWKDEEPEAGTFRLADQDVLKNRTIGKAKRSLQTESSSSGSIFAGFAWKTPDSSFPKPSLSTGVTLNLGSNLTFQPKSNGTAQKSASANRGDSTDSPEYLHQLKVLNENILSWIQKHVGQNPYCILTPPFKDYEKHLNGLEKKYCAQGTDSSQDKSSISVPPAARPEKHPSPSVFRSSGKPLGSGFSFGQSLTSRTASRAKTASSQEEKDSKGAKNHNVTLSLSPEDCCDVIGVSHLAAAAEKISGIPPERQKLIFKGKTLTDPGDASKGLRSMGIKDGSKVMLLGTKQTQPNQVPSNNTTGQHGSGETANAEPSSPFKQDQSKLDSLNDTLIKETDRLQATVEELEKLRSDRNSGIKDLEQMKKRLLSSAETFMKLLESLDSLRFEPSDSTSRSKRKSMVDRIQTLMDRCEELSSSVKQQLRDKQ